MPSGPKKRLRAKRKKQGSPAIDANSDRETEALSVTGSMDVDDLESGQDTPVKASSRPAFLDKEAVSSQTDEWVRVSDFDVGTPTSQTEENDPSAEDGDIGSSRRSLDKLAEWETVSGEHIPGRQGGSINNLEEEPSECEAASAHSSESYTNLPSPHVADRDKDGDNSDTDRKNRVSSRSSCSSGFTSSTEEKGAPAATETLDSSASVDIGEDISSARHVPRVPAAGKGQIEEIERVNEDSVEEKVMHGAVPVTAIDVFSDETKIIVDHTTGSREMITRAPVTEDQWKAEGTVGSCGPVLMEETHKQGKEEVPTACTESALVATNPDDQEMMSANGKDISEVDALLSIPVPEEEIPNEEKEVLPTADESLTQGSISGDEKLLTPSLNESGREKDAVVASLIDVEDEVCTEEKVASPAIDDSSAADDKEVASTSAEAEAEKTNVDVPFEVASVVEKNSFDPQELTADSLSVKAIPSSGTSEPTALAEGRHLSVSTPVEKNGTEKGRLEAISFTGCCGVLYWLLGWDH